MVTKTTEKVKSQDSYSDGIFPRRRLVLGCLDDDAIDIIIIRDQFSAFHLPVPFPGNKWCGHFSIFLPLVTSASCPISFNLMTFPFKTEKNDWWWTFSATFFVFLSFFFFYDIGSVPPRSGRSGLGRGSTRKRSRKKTPFFKSLIDLILLCFFFCFKNGGWLKSISWRGPHSAESCLRRREKKTRGILSVLTRRDREIPVKSARLIISSQSSTRDPHVRIQHLHTHTHTRITSLTRLWTSWRAE